ncbi:hypothetical protein BaRGS_00006578 [Batillaria attramentaria]|uniref:TonB C-terminal domain-containing protein n=1 Tax=Batillaria attramentaria TaxID=370345 RepID=A0ABD0LRN7_9CAEN
MVQFTREPKVWTLVTMCAVCSEAERDAANAALSVRMSNRGSRVRPPPAEGSGMLVMQCVIDQSGGVRELCDIGQTVLFALDGPTSSSAASAYSPRG